MRNIPARRGRFVRRGTSINITDNIIFNKFYYINLTLNPDRRHKLWNIRIENAFYVFWEKNVGFLKLYTLIIIHLFTLTVNSSKFLCKCRKRAKNSNCLGINANMHYYRQIKWSWRFYRDSSKKIYDIFEKLSTTRKQMTPRNSTRAIKVVLLGEGCVEKGSDFYFSF